MSAPVGMQQKLMLHANVSTTKNVYARIMSVQSKQAAGVRQAIIEQLKPFAHKTHTLTTENDKEFAQHKRSAVPTLTSMACCVSSFPNTASLKMS